MTTRRLREGRVLFSMGRGETNEPAGRCSVPTVLFASFI